jgi:hypothetical protein
LNTNGELIPRPLFLVGSERSGTTLLRIMLDSHPKIAFFFEFQYAVTLMPEFPGWPDLNAYYTYLEIDYTFQAARLTIDKSLDYPKLINSFLRQKQDRDGKPLVGATVHHHFDKLLRIWPDAAFIHIIRDGRDVGRSVMELEWAGNMYMAVQRWIDAEALWSRLRQELAAGRSIEVRYETLVSEPENTLREICKFAGVPYHPAMLEYPSRGSTYASPSPKGIGQWKTKLSPRQVQLAEARIGTMLTERGYELSGYPPLKVTRVMEKQLWFQNRLACAMASRRRSGTGLFLAELAARKLGLRSWQKRVARRLHKRQNEVIKSIENTYAAKFTEDPNASATARRQVSG